MHNITLQQFQKETQALNREIEYLQSISPDIIVNNASFKPSYKIWDPSVLPNFTITLDTSSILCSFSLYSNLIFENKCIRVDGVKIFKIAQKEFDKIVIYSSKDYPKNLSPKHKEDILEYFKKWRKYHAGTELHEDSKSDNKYLKLLSFS